MYLNLVITRKSTQISEIVLLDYLDYRDHLDLRDHLDYLDYLDCLDFFWLELCCKYFKLQ